MDPYVQGRAESVESSALVDPSKAPCRKTRLVAVSIHLENVQHA